jgi:hypothetical protein
MVMMKVSGFAKWRYVQSLFNYSDPQYKKGKYYTYS